MDSLQSYFNFLEEKFGSEFTESEITVVKRKTNETLYEGLAKDTPVGIREMWHEKAMEIRGHLLFTVS